MNQSQIFVLIEGMFDKSFFVFVFIFQRFYSSIRLDLSFFVDFFIFFLSIAFKILIKAYFGSLILDETLSLGSAILFLETYVVYVFGFLSSKEAIKSFSLLGLIF